MANDTTSGSGASSGDAPAAPEPAGLNTPANIRRLKFVVAGMGAILVLGFAVIVAVIIQRASGMGERRAALPAGHFGVSQVGIAPGEKVRSVTLGDGRLAVHVGSDSAEAVILIDPKTGEELGRVVLAPMSGFASR